MKKLISSLGMLLLLAATGVANASDHRHNITNKECANNVGGVSFDEEFGEGAGALTTCIKKRTKVKVVYQLNQQYKDGSNDSKPYGLGNIQNAINDYEINYGMKQGRDYEIVAVATSAGGKLLINKAGNQFKGAVQNLMDQGVKFLFCQNTVRGLIKKGALTSGAVTSEIIPGVEFVTSGVAAMPDLVSQGYILLQP
ncbi:MAG: DsrE family protein [Gammaproteobacteria bacterium]|nr:DsrE family protein [Gammaproteobacteria bacterium]